MTNKEVLDAFNELKEEFTTRLSVVEAQNAAILEEIGKKKANQKKLVVTEQSVTIAKRQGVKRPLNSDQKSRPLTAFDASKIGEKENQKKELVAQGNVTFVKQGVKRRLLTPQQKSSLLAAFDASKYLDKERLQKLSVENTLGEDQIKKWFDNKRFRTARQSNNFCDDDAAVASTSAFKPITVKKEVFSGINVSNGEQSEDKENNEGGGPV
uniref:Homeobox domain-containing protein n=1 Tax=Meloidogyne incognita TaxID=6306 RepID=A0A914NE41_MELIC